NDDVINTCFEGTVSRIQGAGFEDLEYDQKVLAAYAAKARKPILPGGLLKYVHGQEYHAYNPDVVQGLHAAVQNGDYGAWRDYAALVNNRPVATLRDLMKIRDGIEPVPLDEVEPIEKL